jgi:hypothetical protein
VVKMSLVASEQYSFLQPTGDLLANNSIIWVIADEESTGFKTRGAILDSLEIVINERALPQINVPLVKDFQNNFENYLDALSFEIRSELWHELSENYAEEILEATHYLHVSEFRIIRNGKILTWKWCEVDPERIGLSRSTSLSTYICGEPITVVARGIVIPGGAYFFDKTIVCMDCNGPNCTHESGIVSHEQTYGLEYFETLRPWDIHDAFEVFDVSMSYWLKACADFIDNTNSESIHDQFASLAKSFSLNWKPNPTQFQL